MPMVKSINFNFTFVHFQKISSRGDSKEETSIELKLGESDFFYNKKLKNISPKESLLIIIINSFYNKMNVSSKYLNYFLLMQQFHQHL